MGKLIDLTGQKYGKLTVIKREKNDNKDRTMWLCQCDCSEKTQKIVRGSHLKDGLTVSCGCFRKDGMAEWRINLRKKGIILIYPNPDDILYSTIKDIYGRCFDYNYKYFERYGGRGITVDITFYDGKVFSKYLKELSNYDKRNELNLTVDRIDNSKNYEPNNLRWATKKEQIQNSERPEVQPQQRFFKAFDPEGNEHISNNRREFCRIHNLNRGNVFQVLIGNKRTVKGWTFEYLDEVL